MCTRIFTWWSSRERGAIPNRRSVSKSKRFCIGRQNSGANPQKSTPSMKRVDLVRPSQAAARRERDTQVARHGTTMFGSRLKEPPAHGYDRATREIRRISCQNLEVACVSGLVHGKPDLGVAQT